MRFLLLALAAALLAAPAGAEPIAVLDTGIDDEHPELQGRVTRMAFVEYAGLPGGIPFPDPGAVEDDPDGHGTAAASAAAGSTLGVATTAALLDLQVDARGLPAIDAATEAAAVRAMDWLLQHHGGAGDGGARVVLLSFADVGTSAEGGATLAAQATQLHAAGVAVVVPAAAQPGPLQDSPAVLTVTVAGTCGDAAAGPAAKPDLAAPGTDVDVAQPGTPVQPGPTGTATGTHLAAAHVAGVAALVWDARPDLPVDALYQILRATAEDEGTAGPDGCSGHGAVDAARAVEAAQAWRDPFVPGDLGDRGTPGPAPALLLLALAALAVAARRR